MKDIFITFISIFVLSASIFAQGQSAICPTIQVISPASPTNPGETMTFSTKIGDGSEISKLKYEWSVSAGTIIEGQNTSAIRVATTPEMGDSMVAAKVTVQGLPADCPKEVTGEVAIAPVIRCILLDDYGKVSSPIEKSMVDSFFAQLSNYPETIAFFRLLRDDGETIKQTKSRIKRIIKLADSHKFDKRRLIFFVGKSETNSFGYLTTAYLSPKNNELPKCENREDCEIIKGEDVK